MDLKKTYQHFEYAELRGEGVVDGQEGQGQTYEGMTQNTYLFVQEKTTLTKDTLNMSLYFLHRFCEPQAGVQEEAFKSFPFDKVRDRVCFIFQKYQEQPSLLDALLEELIQPIMAAVKTYLALLLRKGQEEGQGDGEGG